MAVIVQKYGGSSVADVERIGRVADRVAATRASGRDVAVVVSAMGDTTDDLLSLARQVTDDPPRRELDMLLSAGERISMALLSMALNARGVPAVSFTGSQSGIITNDAHTNARIVEVRPFRVEDELSRGKVVIVAGYQGVSYKKEVTTLGRGGSDTTAVALAAALDAEACEIYSDVDGVFSADPRIVPEAKPVSELSYEEMQELAEAGARVLNAQAVEFAKVRGIALYARSAFEAGPGTVIRRHAPRAPGLVTGIATETALTLVSVRGGASVLASLLGSLDEAGAPAKEVLLRDPTDGGPAHLASVLLPAEDLHGRRALLDQLASRFGTDLEVSRGLGAVSAVGAGINARFDNLRRALATLEGATVRVAGLSTSSFRMTFLVPEAAVPDVARLLHSALIEDPRRS
ncbi:MAG TPA: aspartate kinase [Vicinamibacteria bacterium]